MARWIIKLEEKLGSELVSVLLSFVWRGIITEYQLEMMSHNMDVFYAFDNRRRVNHEKGIDLTMLEMLNSWLEFSVSKTSSSSETLEKLLRILENSCSQEVVVNVKKYISKKYVTLTSTGPSAEETGSSLGLFEYKHTHNNSPVYQQKHSASTLSTSSLYLSWRLVC